MKKKCVESAQKRLENIVFQGSENMRMHSKHGRYISNLNKIILCRTSPHDKEDDSMKYRSKDVDGSSQIIENR